MDERLIQPPEGMGMGYVDWSANEFGTAAGLSGDELMKEAYQSQCPTSGLQSRQATLHLRQPKKLTLK